MDKNKLTVAVLFGGRSVEHEVSVITAQQIIAALPRDKYQAVPVYIDKQGRWHSGRVLTNVAAFTDQDKLLRKAMPVALDLDHGKGLLVSRGRHFFGRPLWSRLIDVVLPAGHGAFLEDGCLQGVLELAGIPYAGPGPLGAAVGMDKIVMKAVLKEAGLPVLDYHAFSSADWRADEHLVVAQIEQELALSYPLVVKPADLGSSIGVFVASNREELYGRIREALAYSRRVLVEPLLEQRREINCAVLGDAEDLTWSAFEEPLDLTEILSFEDKYLGAAKGGAGRCRLPAELDKDTEQRLRRYAADVFRAVDGRGVCRIDFLLDEKNKAYINELNTVPGSLAFYLFEPQGLGFGGLLDRLIQLAVKAREESEQLVRVYASNILASGTGKGETVVR